MVEPKWKIGFVVEGDIDKAVVEEIARRILSMRLNSTPFKAYAVRLGGRLALRRAYSSVLALLDESEYDHVIVVLDADSARKDDVERTTRHYEDMMRAHQLTSDDVSVCLAVPTIEAWLLPDTFVKPEEVNDPKYELLTKLGVPRLHADRAQALASAVDLDKLRRRSPSFDKFAKALEHVADKLMQPASAA